MPEPSVPLTTLTAEILAGRYDGDLLKLVEAIQGRFVKSQGRKYWRIRFDGDEWTEETVTLGEIATAERALGVSWLDMDPAGSAQHLEALIAAHIAKRDDVKYTEALKVAGGMAQGDLLDVLSHYEKAPAPKD